MLEVKQFDTSSVQELIQEYKEYLIKAAGVTLYDSDLEVVLLELWALMVDMQNYTMDVTTEEMKKAMSYFLFEEDMKPQYARGMIMVQPDTSSWILTNTSFTAIAELPFTCSQPTYVQATSICSLEYQRKHHSFPLSKPLIITDETPFILTLSNPLEVDQPCSIYVNVKEANAKPERDVLPATLALMYESVHGLCYAELLQDETYGCLTSGSITFTIHKEHRMNLQASGYELRIILKKRSMDAYACIHEIFLNPVKIRQAQTLAVTYHMPLTHTIRIQDTLAISGHVSVMVKTDACLKPCAFTKTIRDDGVVLQVQHSFEEAEKELYVILQDHSLEHDGIIASTTGVSMQQVFLPYDGITNMKLLIKQSDGWHEANVYEQGSFQDVERYGAWLDVEAHTLQFGCGNDFMIPEQGIDNVVISELTITKGLLGNINAHVLSKENNIQPYPIQGGRNQRSIDEFIDSIPELLQKQHTITTCADVCDLIQRFPGNHLTHIASHAKQSNTTKSPALGYEVLIKGELPLHKKYIHYLSTWLMNHLPAGIPCDLIEADLLQLSIKLCMIPSSSSITKEQIQELITKWIIDQSFNRIITVSSLIQKLEQAKVAYKISSCHLLVDQEQVNQCVVPQHCICEITAMQIEFLSRSTKEERI